jgi:hypothetical protein
MPQFIAVVFMLSSFLFTAAVSAQQNRDEIIYQSPMLLTKAMMDQHAQFVQQLLDINYTTQQKEKHYQLIKVYWQSNDYKGMQAIQSNLEFAKQLKALPAAEMKATILQMRSSLILSLIQDAKNAEDSKWYLQNYLAANPPLASEDIPFIKETADGLIDGEFFINRDQLCIRLVYRFIVRMVYNHFLIKQNKAYT